MLFDITSSPLQLILSFIALVIAITIHEFSHALAADRLGDPTPRLQDRLTLNPMAHLDPIGTLALLLFRFGWGRPVQFDPYNLRNPIRDSAIISFAGPLSNIILATIVALVLRILVYTTSGGAIVVLLQLLQQIIIVNVILAVFNLIPVHPLDGFKIVGGLLPKHKAHEWYELERYGYIFLLVMMVSGVIGTIIQPPARLILNLLLP